MPDPSAGRVSQGSWRSGFGVPVGVLLALSTRVCLEPDRGVMLLLRNAETGDVTSSRSREAGPLAVRVGSGGAVRRASGVMASVGVWWWDGAVREAILGVRGGLFTRATVGGLWPTAADRSYDGMLATVIEGSGFGAGPGFTVRNAGVAFWSRNRSGWRDACGSVAVPVEVATEFAGAAAKAVPVVVVSRAVLLPVALVLVVKIPADGFLLRASGGGKFELPAAAAGWQYAGRFNASAWGFVVAEGGMASRTSLGRNWGIPTAISSEGARCRPNPDSVLGALSGCVPSNDNAWQRGLCCSER